MAKRLMLNQEECLTSCTQETQHHYRLQQMLQSFSQSFSSLSSITSCQEQHLGENAHLLRSSIQQVLSSAQKLFDDLPKVPASPSLSQPIQPSFKQNLPEIQLLAQPHFPKSNILIISSASFHQKMLNNTLRRHGFLTKPCHSGEEALALLLQPKKSLKIDLILLDIDLPDIPYHKIYQRIRDIHPPSSLSILLLTSPQKTYSPLPSKVPPLEQITLPLQKEELLTRVQQQTELLSAYRELETLRQFFTLKGSYFEIDDTLEEGLDILEEQQVIHTHTTVHIPKYQSKSKLIFLDTILKESSFYECLLENNETSRLEQYAAFHTALLQSQTYPHRYFLLLKRSTPFSLLDQNYIQTVIQQAEAYRGTSPKPFIDNQLLIALSKILPQQKRITHIKSQAPYCKIFFEGHDTSESIRVSLRTLDLYFKNEPFIRIHDSYMIHKDRITHVFRPPKGRHQHAILKGCRYSIPIGPRYLDHLKGFI